MVLVSVKCRHCGSEDVVRNGVVRNGVVRNGVVRNGVTRNGKQSYKCKSCGRRCRENSQHERYSAAQKEQIVRAYLERPSMRGIERIFGVSRATGQKNSLKIFYSLAVSPRFPPFSRHFLKRFNSQGSIRRTLRRPEIVA